MSTAHRFPRALLAALASVPLLAGCSGSSDSDEAASSSAAPSSTEETQAPDLESGLLPAEAFGPDATVSPVPADQLELGAGLAAGEDAEITPETCRTSVDSTQPDIADFEDVAAQSATVGATATVQMLLRGGPVEDLAGMLGEAADRCPEAQITSPAFGTATITFEELPVDELGDGSALVRFTTAVTVPGGPQVTVPALVAAVQDGDRLMVLLSVVADPTQAGPGAIDEAAFTELLGQAYETQADALG